jgi:uncharacterized protein (DUF4213/DUF364 family)
MNSLLDETAEVLRGLCGADVCSVIVERVVVGVFFTGVRLSNGCGGIAYTPPDNIRRASVRILKGTPPALRGRHVLEVVDAATAGPFAGVIRLATVNALSAPFLDRFRSTTAAEADVSDFRELFAGRRVCMVGAIVPLLKRLGELKLAELAVVEQKAETLAEYDPALFVPAERAAEALARCETAILTGATIANGTFSQLLAWVNQRAAIAVVGPTAGFVPHALFRRNVAIVGTAVVTDSEHMLDVIAEGGGAYQLLGSSVRKINLVNRERLADLGFVT